MPGPDGTGKGKEKRDKCGEFRFPVLLWGRYGPCDRLREVGNLSCKDRMAWDAILVRNTYFRILVGCIRRNNRSNHPHGRSPVVSESDWEDIHTEEGLYFRRKYVNVN
uniref:Uncharacterized protein n=1 Tax=Candidatus Kentrum sp. LPFa TaxID=2126335 RepID=A0A450WQ97_9GAMM|nr:MAG: hypothetical protein BECKLPF1236B_GA0070989_116310 [Candidatus Kentron sp. LPFa]